MLSPQMLERVSCSYRRGYYDGYDGKPAVNEKANDAFDGTGEQIRPFTNFDYAEGHKAGSNDARVNRLLAERNAALIAKAFEGRR